MGKAEWVKVTPASGSGNATVNVSSNNEHTGREPRTSVLTWKAANVQDVSRSVSQAGKPEFVDIDDAASADRVGKLVTISGVSNSKRLTFSLGTGNLQISLPASYVANSVSTLNGNNINGDPGSIAAYEFSITIDVPANTGTSALSRQIIVEDNGGHRDVCDLTLAAGEAYIRISANVIELDYLGTPIAVAVESNTTWTVE